MDVEIIKLIITGIISPSVALGVKFYYDKKQKDLDGFSDLSLLEHPFFERMKCLRTQIQYSFELQNRGKQEIFKDILLHKLTIVIEEYWKMVNEVHSRRKDMEENELFNVIIEHIREGLKIHESYYRSSEYTFDEQKALELVMDKFHKWDAPRLDNLTKSVEIICTSRFYKGVEVRTSIALDLLLSSFIDTVNDAELTLNELNGDLRGLIFKGITI